MSRTKLFAISTGVAAGMSIWLGGIGNAGATNFGSGPVVTLTPNKAITVYALRSDMKTTWIQRGGTAWQSSNISVGGFGNVFNSEPGAAVATGRWVNGSPLHQIVCIRDKAVYPQQDRLMCYTGNTKAGADPWQFQGTPNEWVNYHFRNGPPAVINMGLDSSSHVRIYGANTDGTINTGWFDGECSATGNVTPCLHDTSPIITGGPTDLQGLGAALVNEGDGLRVFLCGKRPNSEFWCAKSTDSSGLAFGAWSPAPGSYSSAPAVARWRTGFGDAEKLFGLSTFDPQLWTTMRFFATYTNPEPLGGDLINGISVATYSTGNNPPVLIIFGRAGFDGQMWYMMQSESGSSGWSPWF